MASVSGRFLELAGQPKRELAGLFTAGSPPNVAALTGFEFRGYNQPRAAALLGIRKFIKAFYVDGSGQPFGCNTPVARNGLRDEWLARPSADQPKRYAFFRVEPADPSAADQLQRRGALLDYSRGGNKAYDVARILRDYLVRVESGSDELLLGKALFLLGGVQIAESFFLIERYRPLADAEALARR
ncbi:MAG: hypothetical protein ACLQFR_25240 [Streptosporangiaceae bacterium]